MGCIEGYADLEREFLEQVKQDNKDGCCHAHYLGNVEPKCKADYVLIAMEPALDKKCETPGAKCRDVESKGWNFVNTIEDFVLHFCIRRYLREEDKAYHITDMAKTQMSPDCAKHRRRERWKRWYRLLEEERKLAANENALVISIGREVEGFLNAKKLKNYYIVHYSPAARGAHRREADECPDKFREFKETFTAEELESTARKVLEELPNTGPADEKLARLSIDDAFSNCKRRRALSRLAFSYKGSFGRLRCELGLPALM